MNDMPFENNNANLWIIFPKLQMFSWKILIALWNNLICRDYEDEFFLSPEEKQSVGRVFLDVRRVLFSSESRYSFSMKRYRTVLKLRIELYLLLIVIE